MRRRLFSFFLILLMMITSLSINVLAEEVKRASSSNQIVPSSVSFSNVKTKQDVKSLSKNILDDYDGVFDLSNEYTKKFKRFKRDLNKFLETSQEDYLARRENSLEEIETLNKRIKNNTRKRNNAIQKSDEKNVDYYNSLINADKNRLVEVGQIMDGDYDVYIAVKKEVVGQLDDAKAINRSIKRGKDSSLKTRKKFVRFSNKFISASRGKKRYLKKVINSATSLHQKLFLLETRCRKQLQYFVEYNDSKA